MDNGVLLELSMGSSNTVSGPSPALDLLRRASSNVALYLQSAFKPLRAPSTSSGRVFSMIMQPLAARFPNYFFVSSSEDQTLKSSYTAAANTLNSMASNDTEPANTRWRIPDAYVIFLIIFLSVSLAMCLGGGGIMRLHRSRRSRQTSENNDNDIEMGQQQRQRRNRAVSDPWLRLQENRRDWINGLHGPHEVERPLQQPMRLSESSQRHHEMRSYMPVPPQSEYRREHFMVRPPGVGGHSCGDLRLPALCPPPAAGGLSARLRMMGENERKKASERYKAVKTPPPHYDEVDVSEARGKGSDTVRSQPQERQRIPVEAGAQSS